MTVNDPVRDGNVTERAAEISHSISTGPWASLPCPALLSYQKQRSPQTAPTVLGSVQLSSSADQHKQRMGRTHPPSLRVLPSIFCAISLETQPVTSGKRSLVSGLPPCCGGQEGSEVLQLRAPCPSRCAACHSDACRSTGRDGSLLALISLSRQTEGLKVVLIISKQQFQPLFLPKQQARVRSSSGFDSQGRGAGKTQGSSSEFGGRSEKSLKHHRAKLERGTGIPICPPCLIWEQV